MKKCSHCGAVQKDSRMTCIDCGAPLGSSLDDKSEVALEDMLDDKLDGLSERAEDFYVPMRDRILAVVCIVGIEAGGGAVTAICTLFVSAFMLLFPKV